MSDIPVTREDRVLHIMRLMAADPPLWPKPGTPDAPTFRRALAEEWGCAEPTIRDYAAEASRNLRADPTERDYLRYLVAKRFDRISQLAEVPQGKTGSSDWRAAIEALDKYGEYMGLKDESTNVVERAAPTIVIEPPPNSDAAVEPGPDGDGDGGADAA